MTFRGKVVPALSVVLRHYLKGFFYPEGRGGGINGRAGTMVSKMHIRKNLREFWFWGEEGGREHRRGRGEEGRQIFSTGPKRPAEQVLFRKPLDFFPEIY